MNDLRYFKADQKSNISVIHNNDNDNNNVFWMDGRTDTLQNWKTNAEDVLLLKDFNT